MATIVEKLVVALDLDGSSFATKAKQVEKSAQEAEKAYGQLGQRWANTLRSVVMGVAAPIAAGLGIFSSISGYASQVGEVARLTGAYSEKLEEWRKKRALLSRVTQEDIAIYKQGREAVLGFRITMDDLTAKLTRMFYPALKWGIDLLNGFTQWLGRNQNNIARFFTIAAVAITAIFMPALVKMGLAMLANPLTWLITGIGLLILAIDDLVVYMHGGKSAFGEFWAMFGTGEEISQKVGAAVDFVKGLFEEWAPTLKKVGISAAGAYGAFSVLVVALRALLMPLRLAWTVISPLVSGLGLLGRVALAVGARFGWLGSIIAKVAMGFGPVFAQAGAVIVKAFSGGFALIGRYAPILISLLGKGLTGAFAMLGKVALTVLSTIAAHPIILAILAIAAAVYGLVKAFQAGGGTISGMLDYLRGLLVSLVGDWGVFGDAILAAFDFVADGVRALVAWIGELPASIGAWVNSAINFCSQLGDAIGDLWGGFKQAVSDALGSALAVVSGGVDGIINFFATLPGTIEGVFTELVAAAQALLTGWLGGIPGIFSTAFDQAAAAIKSIFSALWEWIKSLFDIGGLVNNAIDGIKNFGNSILDTLGLGDDDEDDEDAEEGEGTPQRKKDSAVFDPGQSSERAVERLEPATAERTEAPAQQAPAAPQINNNVTVVENGAPAAPSSPAAAPAAPVAPAAPQAPAQSSHPYSNGTLEWAQQYAQPSAPNAPAIPQQQAFPTTNQYQNAYYNSAANTTNNNQSYAPSMTQNNNITINTTGGAQNTARAVTNALSQQSSSFQTNVMAVETGTRI